MSPLLTDLRAQQQVLKQFVAKALLLLCVGFGLDRLAGWVFLHGLDRYFGLDVPAQVLCVGHSHTVLGIDKLALEQALGVPVAKFAVEGANTSDRLLMVRYYLKRQPASVRAVVYDVDAHTFTSSGLSSSSYRLLFPFLADPDVRDYVRRNCPSRIDYLLRRLVCTTRYNELMFSLVARGYLSKWSNFKFGQVDPDILRQQIQQGRFRRIAFDQDNIHQFEGVMDCVTTNRATLFLAYIPTIDILNRAEPEEFQRSISMFSSFAATNPNVVFLNYNSLFEARHGLFHDAVHLNREGQRELTVQLAHDLKSALGQPGILPNGQIHVLAN